MKLLYKLVGETTLELLRRSNLRKPYAYAGRLDPLAEGLVIALEGEEVHTKETFLSLPKVYELTVLLGIGTDTYDPLGLPTAISAVSVDEGSILSAIDSTPSEYTQEYPPYSAKPVQGKPLWEWSREGKIDSIVLPTNTVSIYDIALITIKKRKLSTVITEILSNIALVKGDFRQGEIIELWTNLHEIHRNKRVTTFKLIVHCSSGTYMRDLAVSLGNRLHIPSLALTIKRVSIGDYRI